MSLEQAAQSEWLTLVLACLNVLQVVWLADIASRSRQRRAADRRHARRKPRE